MFKTMGFWGNYVGRVEGCFVVVFNGVDKSLSFPVLFARFFQAFLHNQNHVFLSVCGGFVPTINNPNKNNNELNKPILLLGGCV